MKPPKPTHSVCTNGLDDAASDAGPRQFKHRITAQGIDSKCLQCGLLVGTAQDEWLLLSLELVHVCDAEVAH